MKKDYHKTLGVSKSASKAVIKSAYRKLALKYHPDKNKSQEAHAIFVNVNEAYAYLSEDHEIKPPLFKNKPQKASANQDIANKKMEWAKKYAEYKRAKEENIAAISYHEIQNSYKSWLIPLLSWMSIGFAILIFLDFHVLKPNKVQVNYTYEYMNSSNNTMVFFIESADRNNKVKFGEFAVDIKDVNKLNMANPRIYNCEFTSIFNEQIYLSFNLLGKVGKVFNYQSTYTIFYLYFVILLLPIITLVSKGPNMVHIVSSYIISSIVFFVNIILSISLMV